MIYPFIGVSTGCGISCHSLALKEDSKGSAWGSNASGKLDDGTVWRNTPVKSMINLIFDYGDINGDGTIDILDVIMTMQNILGIIHWMKSSKLPPVLMVTV